MTDLNLTYFDYIILLVMLYSTLAAFFKGLIRALSSFCGWIIAAFGSYILAKPLGKMLKVFIDNNLVSYAIAAIISFILSLLLVSFLNNKIMHYTLTIRAGALDRSLGFAFGFLRGMLLSCVLFQIILVSSLIINHRPGEMPLGVKKAKTYQLLNQGSGIIMSYIPKDLVPPNLVPPKMLLKLKSKDSASNAKNSDNVMPNNIQDVENMINIEELSKELNILNQQLNPNQGDEKDITHVIKSVEGE
jgi:membrane protein required for colicin V production